MPSLRTLTSFLRNLFHRDLADSDLDDEVRAHLNLLEEEKRREGLSPADARRATRTGAGLDTLWQDVRFAFCMLRRNAGFTAVAVLTLALGIGANTAAFSVVHGVLLRPLPYPHPEQLYTLKSNESVLDFDDLRAQLTSFSVFGAATRQALDYTGGSEPLQIRAALCDAGYFEAFGVPPALGRVPTAAEDHFSAERTVVLSYAFWQQQFASDPGVLGRAIPLSGDLYTVIGVMPAGFLVPGDPPDLWALVRIANPVAAQFRGVHFLRTYLRLKPEASLAQARAELANADIWLERKFPESNRDRHRVLIPLHERIVGQTRPALLILFGAVGLVLLIACVNFAGLLLARSSVRQKEIAIRAALGAGRRRLLRQILTESVLLSTLGGACGVLVARGCVRLLFALKPENLPRLAEISVDYRVLGFAFAVSLLTGIIFGFVPALVAARLDVNDGLKETVRGSTGGARAVRGRNLLVVLETALAVVLLAGAGLLIRSFWMLHQVDPGFRSSGLLTMRVELPDARYHEKAKQEQFRTRLLEALNGSPGTEAAMVSELPMSGDYLTHNFVIEGRPPVAAGAEPELQTRTVAGNYFRTMRMPLLRGRDFNSQDTERSIEVAVVNESFVRTYFPGQEPLGARFQWARSAPGEWLTIVGVVGDVKHFGADQPEEPAAYDLYTQTRQEWKRWMYVVVRSSVAPTSLTAQVKSAAWKLDPQIPLAKVRPMDEVLARSESERVFNLILLGAFASVALALVAVGIYGVIAAQVARRTQEFGIRMALGAQPGDVLKAVLALGARLAAAGGLIGLVAALGLARLTTSLLFGVSATDPVTFVCVAALLFAVAMFATWIPARRALRVDPIVALRHE